MMCQNIPADFDAPDCPAPATMRLGRRLYCTEHAPEGSVDLDAFAVSSATTVHDKAAEYDKMATYLRQQAWKVTRESRSPVDGRVVQTWEHPGATGLHDIFSALKVEHFKDAPPRGERMREMLRGLDEVMDAKAKRMAAAIDKAVAQKAEEDRTWLLKGLLHFLNIRDNSFPGEPPLAAMQSSRANKLACRACKVVNPIRLYADGTCSHCADFGEPQETVTRKRVVSAVILRTEHGGAKRVLLTLRNGRSAFPNHWECPGGKVEPGESDVDALRRELTEELGVTSLQVDPQPVGSVDLDPPLVAKPLVVVFYRVEISPDDPPRALQSRCLVYFEPEALDLLQLMPANRALCEQVKAECRTTRNLDTAAEAKLLSEAADRGACSDCWRAHVSGLRPCCAVHGPEAPELGRSVSST